MTERLIRLTEYQTLHGIELSHEERLALSAVLPSVMIRASALGDGLYDLTPGSVVGTARIDELSVLIAPKFGIPSLAFMLSYSYGRIVWGLEEFEFEDDASLTELIVPGFLAALGKALKPGVLQGYRKVEDSSSTIRGRIRFDDQLRCRYGSAPPVEVRYDEFTEDIEENRLLKAALRRLSALRVKYEEHRRALRMYAAALRDVTSVEYDACRLPEIPLNRLNARYEQALEIAKLILRSTAIDVEAGALVSSTFTVDMNDVFEDFVVSALREQLHLSPRVFPQNARRRRLRFDVGEAISLKPDFSWWEGGVCRLVGDVKYKRTDDAIKHPDLYQLNAYATATGLPGGILIYAAGEAVPTIHVVAHTGKRLLVRVLDVTGSPKEVLARVATLAGEIESLKNESYALADSLISA